MTESTLEIGFTSHELTVVGADVSGLNVIKSLLRLILECVTTFLE